MKRIKNEHHHSAHTEVYFNDKQIAYVEIMGNFPSITFEKGYRKHAMNFIAEDYVIAPIVGVHRILDWHEVKKGKMHCLAAGQTVLHLKPFNFTVSEVGAWLQETGLEKMIEKSKETTPNALKS